MTQPAPVPSPSFTPPAVTPEPPEVPEVPAGPDASKVILTTVQLRTAILDEAGLDEEDMLLLDQTSSFELAGIRFNSGANFPGSTSLYVFAIFYGDQHDLSSDHTPGDVRVYVLPTSAADPNALEWLRYTFNRLNPSMRAERLTQILFITEVSGEWYDKAVLADVIDEDDDTPEVAS